MSIHSVAEHIAVTALGIAVGAVIAGVIILGWLIFWGPY